MKNVVVSDVFSDEQIKEIKSVILESDRHMIMELYNQKITNFKLPDHLEDAVVKAAEEATGEDGLTLSEYQFARYTIGADDNNKPNLIPHFDNAFESKRYTFDYQIDGNTTWPIVVEGTKLILENNGAATFSGTHQIHWRTHKEFKEGEFVDMIFFHLKKNGGELIDQLHLDEMAAKEKTYVKQWESEK